MGYLLQIQLIYNIILVTTLYIHTYVAKTASTIIQKSRTTENITIIITTIGNSSSVCISCHCTAIERGVLNPHVCVLVTIPCSWSGLLGFLGRRTVKYQMVFCFWSSTKQKPTPWVPVGWLCLPTATFGPCPKTCCRWSCQTHRLVPLMKGRGRRRSSAVDVVQQYKVPLRGVGDMKSGGCRRFKSERQVKPLHRFLE